MEQKEIKLFGVLTWVGVSLVFLETEAAAEEEDEEEQDDGHDEEDPPHVSKAAPFDDGCREGGNVSVETWLHISNVLICSFARYSMHYFHSRIHNYFGNSCPILVWCLLLKLRMLILHLYY